MIRQQGPILAGGHEIDADRMLSLVTARAILDLEQIAVVLLVALYRHRAGRCRHRRGETIKAVLVGEVVLVRAGRDERFDDGPGMSAALHDLQQFLVGDRLVQ